MSPRIHVGHWTRRLRLERFRAQCSGRRKVPGDSYSAGSPGRRRDDVGETDSNRLRVGGPYWLRGGQLLLLLAWVATAVWAQQPLTNQDVIQLVKGGLAESVILNAIANQPTQFDISAQALIALKAAGVSDKIIQQM